MKKLRIPVVLMLILCISAYIIMPATASGVINNAEELLDAFAGYREQQTGKFEVALSMPYFNSLSANNFLELSVLLIEAGLTDYHMQYTNNGDLFLEDVVWTEPHVTECVSEQHFRRALENYLADGLSAFQFVVRDKDLYDRLITQGRLYSYAAMCGIENLQVRSTADVPYIIWIDNLQPFSIPWYTVHSQEEWFQAVESMTARNADHFSLILEPDFAETLNHDEDLLKLLEACSSLAEWKSSRSLDGCRYDFHDVVYTNEPRVYCETELAFVEAIRQMGASGINAFRLILPRELYEEVSRDNFAKMQALEADAGMSSCDLQYDSNLRVLIYANAVIHSDATKLSTAGDACAFLRDSVANGNRDITLFCTPELYSYLIGDISSDNGFTEKLSPLGDAVIHAGISEYNYSCSQASHMISVKVEAFYPGMKIVCAISTGSVSSLSDREIETMTTAQQLAELCRADDALTTARQVHDALCKRITYLIDDSTDEDDNAIGALLNGQANCDGYADAFFLVGSLSGLEVRYQHGDSYEKDPDEKYKDVTHLWNLIRISGTWRLVDVTWDDREDDPVYTWFNLGADRAHMMHIWNEEMSVPLLAETDLSERPANEYFIRNLSSAGSIAAEAARAGFRSFSLVFDDPSVEKEDITSILENAITGSFSYEWNEYMRTVTVFFGNP